MAGDGSRSSVSADSYIGSLISLTSKSEIRYEGVLYSINTEESSIGLRNVRSFGTEGRKKDGPQVPPNEKVYEYILFRGSDIKDLQVKSSPPVQTTPPLHNDPAIIQSHYSRPPPISTSLASVGSGTVTDLSSHTAQLGLPGSTFQGGLPLYQPGGNLGSWGPSPPPPSASGTGLAMPMYWPGFYAPSSGLSHVQQQQPLLRPPPGLPIPHNMQQPMQYPAMNASIPTGAPNMPEYPPPLLPPVGSTLNLTSTTLPSTLPPVQVAALASETSPSLISNKAPILSMSSTNLSANLPFVPPLTSSNLEINPIIAPISSKAKAAPVTSLPYQTMSQPVSTIVGLSTSSHTETSVPSLVTPGQLLQPGPSTLSSSQSLQTGHKDVEVVQPVSTEPSTSVSKESQEPLLPLPTPHDRKLNGAPLYTHHYSNRGRERGRGNGMARGMTKFTEDFDFIAMNEKFKKDEVWGHLGRTKGHRDKEEESKEDDVDYDLEEYDAESSKYEAKPVYVKDDFFDSLSCNSLDRGAQNGRTKFSEQMKIDTETFGDFPRYRGGRGGRYSGRGGRARGPYYGRGYGYVGRGQGSTVTYRPT
eukprot:TRINITY_DN137_c0_g1_i2.p1 TRINITY_DN137_c0_g1~~TRINITY_DN137_c0_g1_i2.p1  ORF type:complete len:586 (+),score=76.73 TRINITY_DN137_c0_g1_i2:153-1910(+)